MSKLDHGCFESNDYTHGVLDLESMNNDPLKYATHCLKANETQLVIESTETCPQLLFINGSWQPSNIYKGILKPIEKEVK